MKRRTLSSHVESLDRRILLAAAPVPVANFPVGTVGSLQHEHAEVGNTVFFFATDDPYGSHDDLWKTDGTPGGTVRVKDFEPPADPSTYVQLSGLTAVGGRVFFSAPDTAGNYELWTSDGTDEGTHRVKDIVPGPTGSFPYDFFDFNGTLLFSAETPGAGRELWKSDGTEEGTVLVSDIAPGETPSYPSRFTAFNGKAYFAAYDGVQGGKLWVTDGTEAGTLPVWTSPPGPESLSIVNIRAAGDNLFFVANAPAGGGFDLWRTDGTAAGTLLLREGFFGGTVVRPRELTDFNGTLFFVGDEEEFGTEVWKSDGTVAGTTVVKDIAPGNSSSNPDNLVVLNDTLYFVATDANNHRELWKTDGTEAGTVKAVDSAQGPAISDLSFLTAANGALYFAASSGNPGAADRELWKSDGTPAGTSRVADIAPGPFSSDPEYLFAAANKVFFTAWRTYYDRELWASDGTAAGTVQLADINTTPLLAYPENLVDLNGTLFFTVGVDPSFRELWKSDGTAAGTRRVSDVLVSTYPELVVVNGSLFFKGFNPATGWEVWETDGSDAGTVLVNDTTRGANAAQPGFLFNFNGTLLFSPGVAGVWKSDGTPAGTVPLTDAVNPTTPFVLSGGVGYFGGNDATGDTVGRPGLWRTDGTPAGTYRIDSAPAPTGLVDVQGTLYFNGGTPDAGSELWKTDGTPAGTMMVKDIIPGSQSSYPTLLTALGDKLMFFARSGPANRVGVWRSDGTAAGTVQVGPDNPQGYSVAVAGDTFYFTAYTGVFSLWKSDGTTSSQVKAFDGDMPRELTSVGGTLYFTAGTAATGVELWKSDGTDAGTVLVADLAPGQESSYPSRLTVVGGRALFFDAGGQNLFFDADPALWKLDIPPAVVGRHVFYNHSSFDGNDGDANAADDNGIAPDKSALRPGGAASFANVTSFNKGINGVMVDIAGLPEGATLTADDFEIGGNGTPPASVSVRRGAGVDGSDRVTLTWPDYNPLTDPPTMAVGNGWLRVTVKANERTGLAAPDVFSFGNLIGESGDAAGAAGWRVNALDLGTVKRDLNARAAITSATDFNRDGRINALDLGIAKHELNLTLPPPQAPGAAGGTLAIRRVAEEAGLVA